MKRIFMVLVISLAVFAITPPCLAQTDEQLMEQITKLADKIRASNDVCPYAAEFRQLLARFAQSDAAKADPATFKMIKGPLDELMQSIDQDCANSKRPSSAPPKKQEESTPKETADKIPNVLYSANGAKDRALTEDEEKALRKSLYWSPAQPTLAQAGQAESRLLDGAGRHLATIRIIWDRVRQESSTTNGSLYSATSDFTIELENRSSCLFSSSAMLRRAGDPLSNVVTYSNWHSWVNLQQPDRGRLKRLQRSITLSRSDLNRLEMIPENPAGTTLSQCRTAPPPPRDN